jgi:hypothetical protein
MRKPLGWAAAIAGIGYGVVSLAIEMLGTAVRNIMLGLVFGLMFRRAAQHAETTRDAYSGA